MNFTKYSKYFVLLLISTLVSLAFWYGFYANVPGRIGFPTTTLETIFANYDGPNYMIVSKCGYDKKCIATHYSLPQPLEYYPAHLPGFPLLIKAFSFFTTTPKAMLVATLLGSIFLSIVSFEFFKIYLKEKSALYLAIFMIFFPARLLTLRLVGAPETWFMALTLLSIIYFKKDKYFVSALAAAAALLLKSPGILLFVIYFIIFLKHRSPKFLYYLLVPFTGLAIFYIYYLQTGDFWAYFHSGDNIHLNDLPYLVFISNHTWINTIWLEDVIYIYLISFYGISRLLKKYPLNITSLYPIIYILAAVFVAHRDISRYVTPAYPFLILAFSKFLLNKKAKIIFVLLLPAIILYAINFLVGNTAPIADWTPYL